MTGAKKKFNLAISIMVVASLMLSLQSLFVKLVSVDLSINFLAFVRCFVNLILFFTWHLIRKRTIEWKSLYRTKKWKLHVIRSLGGIGGVYALYYGVKLLSLSSAILLVFSFPLFIPLVARIWLKIKIIHRLWWGLIVAFIGIIFVLRLEIRLFNLVALIPLCGALCIAVAMIAIRQLHYTEPSERIIAYFFTSSTLVTAAIFFLLPDISWEIFDLYTAMMALFVGIFAVLFQVFLILAMKYAPARFLSPFFYVTFIFTAFFDWVIFDMPLHSGLFIGFVFIVIGAALMVMLYPKDDMIFKK